jgi:hypothetical protein
MTATPDILSPAAREPAPRAHLSSLQSHDLNALRHVLLARERAQIADILRRLDDPAARAEELARLLPQAIALRSLDDSALADALRPAMREALAGALHERPELMLGAVREALADLVLKPWRLLAAALRRTRSRRRAVAAATVEKLLLIDHTSGTLLQQSDLPPAGPLNPADMRRQRAIASLLASLRGSLKEPQCLRRYLDLGHLRVEEFTYGIHATATLLLLSVIHTPGPDLPDALLLACKALVTKLDPHAPVLPALPLPPDSRDADDLPPSCHTCATEGTS